MNNLLEKVTPEYCENIVVAAVYRRHFEWYVTPRELWRMDYGKWHEAWRQYFIRQNKSEEEFIKNCGTLEKTSEQRWGITVLNEKTAGKFFGRILHIREDEVVAVRSEFEQFSGAESHIDKTLHRH